MGLAQKIGWRVKYLTKWGRKRDWVLVLPVSLKRKIYGPYPLLTAVSKATGALSLAREGDHYLLKAGDYRFEVPVDGVCEGDFFDIVYPALPKDEFIEGCFDWLEMDGPYEPDQMKVKPGDIVIDAGASLGLFSVVASHETGAQGKVFAFEPRREIIDQYLSKNLALNHCENVSIEEKALGKDVGSITFFVNGLEDSTIVPDRKIPGAKEVTVSQTTLDAFVKEKNLPRVDFIKADIEGAERSMLLGAEETLKKFKPKLALRTYHLKDDPEVISGIVKRFVPEYKTIVNDKTFYAWI